MPSLGVIRTCLIALGIVCVIHGHASEYPAKAFTAKTKHAALQALFGTDRVETAKQLQLGFSGANPEKQRVLIQLGDLKPQRVAILVTRHSKSYSPHGLIDPKAETPLVAVIELTPQLLTPIEAYVQLALPSRIDVVAQVGNTLYATSTEIDFTFRGRMGLLELG